MALIRLRIWQLIGPRAVKPYLGPICCQSQGHLSAYRRVPFSNLMALSLQHLCKNYICAASRNTRDRIMLIRAKHRTIV